MTDFLLSNFGHAELLEPVDADDTLFVIDATLALRLPEPGVGEAFSLSIWDGSTDPEIVYCTSNPGTGQLVVTRAEEDTTPQAWLAGTELRNAITRDTAGAILQAGFVAANLASQAEAEAGVSNTKLMSPLRVEQHWESKTTVFSEDWLTSADVIEARAKLGWEVALFSGTGLEDTFTLPDDDWATPYTQVYIDEVFVNSADYTITLDQLVFDTPPDAGTDNILVVKGINFAFSIATPGTNTVTTAALQDNAVTLAKMADNSVGTNELIANSVTYGKIQQVSDTDKVLGRSSAGAGNIEEIPHKTLARQIGNADTVAAIQAILTSAGWPHSTGMLGMFLAAAAPTGWVAFGGSIGNAASNATSRANADTEALFTLLWNDTAVAQVPIQTSAGAGSTKGASAAADFAANKRLVLPNIQGYFFRNLPSSGQALAELLAETIGPHNHTASFTGAAMPNHFHEVGVYDGVGAGDRVLRGTGSRTGDQDSDGGTGRRPQRQR